MANVPAIDVEKAKEILNSLTSQAQELLKNTSKLEKVLQQMEDKLKEIPKVGDALSRVPLMISMIRSYVTKEYSVVSPKVIITLIAAIIYMVKDQDLIPDSTPVLGHVDDLAILAAAFMVTDPELNAYSQWREENQTNTPELRPRRTWKPHLPVNPRPETNIPISHPRPRRKDSSRSPLSS